MDKKLKILVINRWVGYNLGGNETHIRELAYYLTKKGHKIDIITSGHKALDKLNNLVKIWEVPSKQTYYSSGFSGIFYASLYLFGVFFKYLWLRLVKGIRYDVVSIHFSLEAFLMRFLRMLFGDPYVMVFAGDTDFELREGKYADQKIQITRYVANGALRYGYKSLTIPKGIDLVRYNPKVDSSEIIEKYAPNSEKLILTVCRLDPRKDLITLVSAAKIVIKKMPNVKFLIVGEGEEKDKIKTTIDKNNLTKKIILVGKVPNNPDLLPRYYTAADLFVLPTLYETFGWVFMEAMACGTPIVTTTTGSNPEVVGDVGILVPIKNPEKFAQAMIKLLQNEKQRKILAQKGFEKVKQWSWPKIIKKYEQAYFAASQQREKNFLKRLLIYFRSLSDTLRIILNLLTGTATRKKNWQPSGVQRDGYGK